MKRVLLIVIILLQACGSFVAQAQQINIRKYTSEDGLVNNDISHIYQDSHGFIWLCTRGGLSRYDGSRFTNYTTDNGLTNDMINDIVEIAPQEFIVAQNSDGPRFLKNGRISPLTPGSDLIINNFFLYNNRLVATTDYNGIVQWHNGAFLRLNAAYVKNTQGIAMVNDSLWLIQQDASVQLMTLSLQAWSSVSPLTVTTVFTDSHHQTWVGTAKGLKLLNPATAPGKMIETLSLPSSFDLPILRESQVNDILEDSYGNLWIATSAGLVQVQPNGRSYVFTDADGLPSLFTNCLLEDHQKNIWAGTPLGLTKFSLHNEVRIFKQGDGLPLEGTGFVSPVNKDIARFFSGIGMGELNLVTGKISKYPSKESEAYLKYRISKEEILMVKGRQGEIFKQGEMATKMIKWPADIFSHVVRIDQEKFIGLSGYKLFTIENGNAQERLKMDVADMAYAIYIDDNDFLWIAYFNSGVYKIKLDRNQQGVSLKIVDSIINELPDKHIRALYSDRKNELWIGTRYKGLIRLLESASGKYQLQHYGTGQGLSSNFVRVISRDKKGNIWAGTMQGMDKLIPFENTYRVFNYGKVNKIFSFVYDIRFLQDDWLIAAGFPHLLHVRDMQQDTLSPLPVYITKVSAGNTNSSPRMNAALARLPYSKAQIYFEFSAPQFINEDFTQFSYRLLGSNDTGWSAANKSHSIYFASLRPGNYTFEVRALGFNGDWSPPASYGFVVNTPFWQQPSFIALVIISIGLLVYVLYRYRVQQLIRLQKVRNRIATDLHDEIGSTLTNISILTNLSKKNLSEPAKAGDFLHRISEEVSSSSQALDDIIWSVSSKHDTLDEMVSRMRRYAAELFDSANIVYELQLDPVFEETKLIMEQRRDVYLLFKEAVSNISKHAKAKKVMIKIAVEHNQLVLTIKDDGKGFETNKETNRHGLKGMKERVKKWKGKIEIASAGGKGVYIQIRLPVAT